MAFFTSSFMQARREELKRQLVRFDYQLNGGNWKTGEVNSKEIVGTDVVVLLYAPSSGAADTVTGVRCYDINGALVGSQKVSLARAGNNSALIRFTFPLVEQ